VTPPPAWLAELQRVFGASLRTPLDREQGTLRSRHQRGLSIYNLQYWLRLFEALQSELPLTCRVLGAWAFNAHAETFLLAHPPVGWDLAGAAVGFEAHLFAALAQLDSPDAACDAARIDVAWSEVLRAPEPAPLRAPLSDPAQLACARLVRSPGAVWIEEHRPLLERRATLLACAPDSPLELPAPWPSPRHWLLVHRDGGVLQVPLETEEAHLLRLLEERSVQDSLGELEATCPPNERAALPARARQWLSRAVGLGVWEGTR